MRQWTCLLVAGLCLIPMCHGCHGQDDDIRAPTPRASTPGTANPDPAVPMHLNPRFLVREAEPIPMPEDRT